MRSKSSMSAETSSPPSLNIRHTVHWHPSEVTGLLWAGAMGARGVAEIRSEGSTSVSGRRFDADKNCQSPRQHQRQLFGRCSQRNTIPSGIGPSGLSSRCSSGRRTSAGGASFSIAIGCHPLLDRCDFGDEAPWRPRHRREGKCHDVQGDSGPANSLVADQIGAVGTER